MRTQTAILALLLAALVSCHPSPSTPPLDDSGSAQESPLLPYPFTAEQIREHWTLGLTLTIRQQSPEGEELQQWTVVEWSDEGCAIEYASLDGSGSIVEDPIVQQATWTELRDHAGFPADLSTRVSTTRETPLGTWSGWLYTVSDPTNGGLTQFFFAEDLPGAPLWVQTTVGDAVVAEMEQLARSDLDL